MALIAVMLFSFAMTAWSKRRMARLEAREAAALDALHEESVATPSPPGSR
jgi:hypothetical protein